MISKDQIQEFSKRLAIDEFTIIREYIQVVFLSALYGSKYSQKIYFKGGTAIRLFLKSGRFSEDLDFTSELTAKELDPIVKETVKKVGLTIPDIKLKWTDENKFAYTGILSYQTEGMKYPMNIHVEFSLREKPETSKDTVLETDFPVVSQPVIRHMDWQEILAEKIRAFLYRSKGRDIYDLWFMLSKGVELDWKMINRKTKYYDMTTSLEAVLKRVSEFDEKKLKNDIGKFLPSYDRGLVVRLKEMSIKQLTARQSFVIAASDHLDYTKVLPHPFSGTDKILQLEDMKTTKITLISRRDENCVVVEMIAASGIEATAFIRARSRNGVRELDVITLNARVLKGKSYDDLINHNFKV